MRYAAQAMRAAQLEAERKAARDAEILEGTPRKRQLRLRRLSGGLTLPTCMLHAAASGSCWDDAVLLLIPACETPDIGRSTRAEAPLSSSASRQVVPVQGGQRIDAYIHPVRLTFVCCTATSRRGSSR